MVWVRLMELTLVSRMEPFLPDLESASHLLAHLLLEQQQVLLSLHLPQQLPDLDRHRLKFLSHRRRLLLEPTEFLRAGLPLWMLPWLLLMEQQVLCFLLFALGSFRPP